MRSQSATLRGTFPCSKRVGLRRLLRLLLVIAGIQGCVIDDTRAATRYWRDLRERSLSATRGFLIAAASGDSAQLSRVATDSVVSEVLRYHRLGAVAHLKSAATEFDQKAASVEVYGHGSEVRLKYRHEDMAFRGFVTLSFTTGTLRVIEFGVPANIHD